MEQVADHAIVEYDLTDAQLNRLALDFDPANIPEAKAVGDEGYNIVHEHVMAITKVRTRIEKKRKELKKDALDWGRKVDTEAKRLTGIVEDLESPWRQVKLNLEEAERKASEEKLAAEQARQARIEESIASIRMLSEGLINATAATIDERIETLESLVLTEEVYGDYVEAAQVTGDIVGKALRVALAERIEFEKGQAALKAEQDKMREEMAALKAERDEMDRMKAAQKAAEDAVEAEKAEAAQREADEIREREEAQAKLEEDKKRAGYLKDRMTQDLLVREWAEQLSKALINPPAVPDQFLANLMGEAADMAWEAVNKILANTQGGASS